MNESEYYFYLWIEYFNLCRKWLKWWEDLYDMFWIKKIED
jgi:hypothetical protein